MIAALRQNKKVIYGAGLGLYGFLLYLIVVLLTFPTRKVENWMVSQIQKATETEVSVGEKHFVFPLGTEWKTVVLSPAGKPGPRFEIDRMKVDFSLLSFLFKGKIAVHFDVKGWGGDVRGDWMSEKENQNKKNILTAEGEGLELRQFPWEKGIHLEGKVRFQTEYRWEDPDPVKGKGFMNIEGTGINGKGLSVSGFSLPEMSMARVAGHGVIRDGAITLDRFASIGSLADLTGTGTVLINRPVGKSLLNISMKLTPKEALNKLIPLSLLSPSARPGVPLDLFLKGTVEQPVFTLTGVPL